MRRNFLLSATLLAGLTLAGCSDSTSPAGDGATSAGAGATDSPAVAACADFFAGTGTPLAERADAARADLTGGAVADDVSYGEVNMLEQRIGDLADDAPEEMADTLETVNAPFTEAVGIVNDARAQEVPEGEEAPAFPDLSTIEVTESESAQAALETTCAEAGYEVPAD